MDETERQPLSFAGRQLVEHDLRRLLAERRRAEEQRDRAIGNLWESKQFLKHSWPRVLGLCSDLGLTPHEAEAALLGDETAAQVCNEMTPEPPANAK